MMTDQAMGAMAATRVVPGAPTKAQQGAAMDRRIERAPRVWWRRRGALAAALPALLALLLWRALPASDSTDMAIAEAEIGAVVRAPFADYLPVRATVAPRATTLVGVLSGGQVERLLVQDGMLVAAGQPLATLANPTLQLDVLTREAQIAGQLGSLAGEDLGIERNRLDRSAQVAQARYDLLKAEREFDKRRQLHDHGLLADAGLRSYAEEVAYQRGRLTQLERGGSAEARITATQGARLDDTRTRLERNLAAVRAGLDTLVVRAPADGRLTNFTLQPGQTLRPGDPAGQVDSEGSWKLEADVDEYYLGSVVAGQRAAAGGAALTVATVLPAVTNGRFRVELAFDRAPADLRRGQTLDARITLGSTAPALVAPVGGWLESGGGRAAFVLDPDGRHARRRAIRVGRRNPEQAEILAGLAPGERLVLGNTAAIRGDVINLR